MPFSSLKRFRCRASHVILLLINEISVGQTTAGRDGPAACGQKGGDRMLVQPSECPVLCPQNRIIVDFRLVLVRSGQKKKKKEKKTVGEA